jgi:hypothetical protein
MSAKTAPASQKTVPNGVKNGLTIEPKPILLRIQILMKKPSKVLFNWLSKELNT